MNPSPNQRLGVWLYAIALATLLATPLGAQQDAEPVAPADAGSGTESAPGGDTEATAPAGADGDAGTDAAASASADPEPVPQLSARQRYNLGLEHLAAGDPTAAADEFLGARDEAGPDPALRYRAAFNLGVALAAQVPLAALDADAEGSPEAAMATLRESAAWFNDAVRLAPPDDDDARVNLELVSRRILALADRLNQGNRLEARLDRLIDDQRGIRDQLRRLLTDVEAQAAGASPQGFKLEFDSLASGQRSLMAEVGDGIDLAAEEQLFIEQTPPEQRTAEQRNRVHQLEALADYLQRARQSLGDARRRLRRLEGERGHRRADAALAELKRAREQLLNPVAVLQAVARDEAELLGHTEALAAFTDGVIRVDEQRPGWLTDKHLGERQEDIGARAGGVLSRFEAVATAAPEPTPDPDATPGENLQQLRTRRAVSAAIPALEDALTAMREAIASLADSDAEAAAASQQRGLVALHEAIEQFADVKGLIELAHGGQQGVVALLTPDTETPSELSPDERTIALGDAVAVGQRRLERLRTLLTEDAEVAETAGSSESADSEEQAEQARLADQQRYQRAQELRDQAADSLTTVLTELDGLASGGDATGARTAATDALDSLDELRRLFFSIIEHLQALRADQADTHDRAATLQFESSAELGETLAADLDLVAGRQTRHGAMGDALAAALAEQADASANTPTPATEQPMAERLTTAAAEVRKASNRMHGASALLGDAAKRAANMSPELEPALEDQIAALEHLDNALQALAQEQTGNQNQQQNQQGQQDQQQAQGQQDQQSASQDERMSQRQALKRLQAIRDREAQRQRNRQGEPGRPEPVEKDW